MLFYKTHKISCYLSTESVSILYHFGTYQMSPLAYETRHRASTSMYSLTFCVRFLLPERHQRKPAVQAAAVMLRTPPSPVDSHSPASHAHFPYMARNFENAPITRQSAASSACRPRPASRSHYVVISRDGCTL